VGMTGVMNDGVQREVNRMLAEAPAFGRLDRRTQDEMRDAVAKISSFLSQTEKTAARQLASDPRTLRPGGAPPSPAPAATPAPAASPTAPSPTATTGNGASPAGTSTGGVTGQVGGVARSTLNAIDFPSFVASLIQGTFQAIVDASIQQMEAYAELLKNAATTIDAFTTDNVTDGMARDYLADRYDGVFQRDTTASRPRLKVAQGAQGSELPSFFADMGIGSADDLDEATVEEKVVPATRRMLGEQRQQTLATMVLMGINRIVVRDGEISAKLQFHIDASETTSMKFDQTKQSGMSMSGTAGRNPFAAQGIMVNTAALNAQSAINVRADLVGNVVVRFESQTFPLERFADSAAIQLINTRAKVPSSAAPPAGSTPPAGSAAQPAATTPPALPPMPGTRPAAAPQPAGAPPKAPTATAPAAPAPPTEQQSIDDPWSYA
jgi:hypothetical protein